MAAALFREGGDGFPEGFRVEGDAVPVSAEIKQGDGPVGNDGRYRFGQCDGKIPVQVGIAAGRKGRKGAGKQHQKK